MPSGSRLVASRWTRGQRRKIASAILAQASIRCSQLSSTIRMSCGTRASSSVSTTPRPGGPVIPSAAEMAGATASASVTAASSTSQTPSPVPSSNSAATCRPSRVLPVPPAPVRVTRRADPASVRTSASSVSRPMNAVGWAGRLFSSAGLPSERSGGKPAGRPTAFSWKIRSGRPRSLSRCRPRSVSAASGGSQSRTRAAAVSETRIWPPCATPASRAARCTSRPTRPVAVRVASPVWMPIRTWTCSPAGQAWAASARWISRTAAAQARGEENTAKNASPWVSTSSPS